MDWKKCALRRQDDKNMTDSSKNKDPTSCGYSKLPTNIHAFTQNSLPLPAKLTVGIDDLVSLVTLLQICEAMGQNSIKAVQLNFHF